MKTLSTLVVLVAIFFNVSAQKSISLQVGPSYSHYKNSDVGFGESIGYFGGLNYQDKFSQVLGVDASLYFLNQRNTANDITLSIRSINAIFAVNIYAGSSGLYLILGPEVGHSIDYKYDGEDLKADNDLRFAIVGGIGYQVIENAALFARYHYAIDHQGSGYDYNVQAGFSYKLSKR